VAGQEGLLDILPVWYLEHRQRQHPPYLSLARQTHTKSQHIWLTGITVQLPMQSMSVLLPVLGVEVGEEVDIQAVEVVQPLPEVETLGLSALLRE